MKIYCRVTGTGLVPLDDNDWEQARHLKLGSDVCCSISQPRNIRFHRKFFALLGITFDNLPELIQRVTNITSIETLLTAIKFDLGYFDVLRVGSHEYIKPRSISFAAMSEEEFEKFYNVAVADILCKYLPGTNPTALHEEVRQFIGY